MFKKVIYALTLSICLSTAQGANAAFKVDVFDNVGRFPGVDAGDLFNNSNVLNILAGTPDIQKTSDFLFFGDSRYINGDPDYPVHYPKYATYPSGSDINQFLGGIAPTDLQVDHNRAGAELADGFTLVRSSYIARAQGNIEVDATDVYTLAIVNDDNFTLNIGGNTISETSHSPDGLFRFYTTTLTAGLNSVNLLLHNGVLSGGVAVGIARGTSGDPTSLSFTALTAVPEPSSILLLSGSIFAVSVYNRRRKKALTS